ncbi:MAG: ATP-binding protein, partial [Rhizobiaceae bacterium]
VEDTGIGMTRDQQGRVGTPFYQVDGGHARSHEGTGLGLALVKQMARLHGGSVEIDSEPGRGTKVTVALSSIYAKGANVTPLYKQADDESVRIIRVFEERENGTHRKTA